MGCTLALWWRPQCRGTRQHIKSVKCKKRPAKCSLQNMHSNQKWLWKSHKNNKPRWLYTITLESSTVQGIIQYSRMWLQLYKFNKFYFWSLSTMFSIRQHGQAVCSSWETPMYSFRNHSCHLTMSFYWFAGDSPSFVYKAAFQTKYREICCLWNLKLFSLWHEAVKNFQSFD